MRERRRDGGTHQKPAATNCLRDDVTVGALGFLSVPLHKRGACGVTEGGTEGRGHTQPDNEAVHTIANLAFRLRDRLATLGGHDLGQLFAVRCDEVKPLPKGSRALL